MGNGGNECGRRGSPDRLDLTENYGGFCIECRDQAYGVEPDARGYRCESCGANAVYGTEELLIRGIICFTDEDQ